jgi:hypothetical protein
LSSLCSRPVAEKLGIDLVWFGILMAVNMQTSFMHPPFGFALFYLRSVAPHSEYIDRLTQKKIAPVTTEQIYWGAIPFVIIQVIMVGIIIAFPQLVTGGLDTTPKVDVQNIQLDAPPAPGEDEVVDDKAKAEPGQGDQDKSAAEGDGEEEEEEADDPAKALEQSLKQGKK